MCWGQVVKIGDHFGGALVRLVSSKLTPWGQRIGTRLSPSAYVTTSGPKFGLPKHQHPESRGDIRRLQVTR